MLAPVDRHTSGFFWRRVPRAGGRGYILPGASEVVKAHRELTR
jgi:hypothetical protein